MRISASAREKGEFRGLLSEVLASPVAFSRACLGSEPWAMQRRIMRAVASSRRVAVKACHASGKTFTAACVALWWAARFNDGIVITTAPTWTQVEKILWGEIHRAREASRKTLGKWWAGGSYATELRIGPKNFLIGISTDQPERMQGFHSGRVLIILDEAPGIRQELWGAIEGIRAGGDVSMLCLGNPVETSGAFFEIFNGSQIGWKKFTISAFDTPNFRTHPGREDVGRPLSVEELMAFRTDADLEQYSHPFLVRRRWAWEKLHELDLTHPLVQARVLGQFPAQSTNALYSLVDLEAARVRNCAENGEVDAEDMLLQAGVDVAGPGEDETTLCVRRGGQVVLQRAWQDPNPTALLLEALEVFKDDGIQVAIDTVGIGYYLARQIQDEGYAVIDVNVGLPAFDVEKYVNLKAELYWGLRKRLEEGRVGGLKDERAISQLSNVRYSYDWKGRLHIESKKELARRGIKSPDRGEAVILAFADSPKLGLGAIDLAAEIRL